jgi:hypothetical protein
MFLLAIYKEGADSIFSQALKQVSHLTDAFIACQSSVNQVSW